MYTEHFDGRPPLKYCTLPDYLMIRLSTWFNSLTELGKALTEIPYSTVPFGLRVLSLGGKMHAPRSKVFLCERY